MKTGGVDINFEVASQGPTRRIRCGDQLGDKLPEGGDRLRRVLWVLEKCWRAEML